MTLAVLAGYAAYTLHSVYRMRTLQAEVIDRNRKASVQLIRIQSDLNALALAMRDMLENADGYPLTAWQGQLMRIRENLDDAIRTEAGLAQNRDARQTAYLASSFTQFWMAADRMFETSRSNGEVKARESIRGSLQPSQEALSTLVSRLLIANYDNERQSAEQVNQIYSGIERNAWLFLGVSAVLVAIAGIWMIHFNRTMFEKLAELSGQRSELARQLISTQESTFRAISRDLHDEFGQILTALGAMLRRAGREAPDTKFQEQIQELNVVVQETLEKTRALSQSLQPVMVEEQGLAAAMQWHISVFEKQTGIAVQYTGPQTLPTSSIHVYRILQEALNNIAKHAQVKEAYVHVETGPSHWSLTVEDRGQGISETRKLGIGLVAMRERAELLGGNLTIQNRDGGGTIIHLVVPVEQAVKNV